MKILTMDRWGQEAMSILSHAAELHSDGALITDCDGVIASLDHRLDAAFMSLMPNLRLVATCTTGLDHIDMDYCRAKSIKVISLQGDPFLRDVWATAEHTCALILTLLRKVPTAHNHILRGGFDREMFRGNELRGKTLGIVGYGRVGRQVEQMVLGFGMTPLKCDRGVGPVEWEVILRNSDILTVHVDLNDTTRGMFSTGEFAMMKATAFFINTSRGAVVDEDALLNALRRNRIAGAALDVFCDEPRVNPALIEYARSHDNLILTPHLGGNTWESREKTQIHIAEKIRDYLRGDG